MTSRHGVDFTAQFPELAEISTVGDAVLDGELCVLDDNGRADFDLLQQRIIYRAQHLQARRHPAFYLAFDVVQLDGSDLCKEPWTARREILESLALPEGVARLVPTSTDGPTMFELTKKMKFEGVVSKRCHSRYHPGQRPPGVWVKTKHRRSGWFDVVGWRPPTHRHPGGLVIAEDGKPVGFAMLFLSRANEDQLLELMRKYGRSHGGMLAVPEGSLEAEVAYTERTARGTLREAVCRQLRSPTD